MRKPRLLDLFCGEGGAGAGYARAGFDVVGVDIKPQPRYLFTFIQADAMTFSLDGFDVIHASPPCQRYSSLKSLVTYDYADLLAAIRARLAASGKPWVIENVATAPMWQGVEICGTSLGLNVRRHRRFDSSHFLYAPGPCHHSLDNINVYGHGAWNYHPRPKSLSHWKRHNSSQSPLPIAAAREAFGAPWMTQHGLAECVPPAYTQWIGQQLWGIVTERLSA